MNIAIYCWAGMGNLGDDWLLKTAIEAADRYGHNPTLLLEPRAVAPAFLQGRRVLYWPRVRASNAVHSRFRGQLKEHSRLVLAGGGWFAADRGLKDPLLWLRRMRMLPIEVSSLGLGVGPFSGRAARATGRLTANSMEHIGTWDLRTGADGRRLADLGYTDYRVSSDLALLSWRPGAKTVPQARSGVVVSLPAPQAHWSAGSATDWGHRIKQAVREIASGEKVTFVSFQLGTSSDIEFWRPYFPDVVHVRDVSEFQDMLGAIRCVVAGRLHAGLAAALANVPEMVALGYHHKFDVLARLGVKVSDITARELFVSAPSLARIEAEHRAISDSTRNTFSAIGDESHRRSAL